MINGKLEFTRDGFKEYRTLEAQLAFYQKQLSELRDNYLIVDTVNDYRSGQAHTVTIETVQQTAYARSKAQVESVILDLTQKYGLSEGLSIYPRAVQRRLFRLLWQCTFIKEPNWTRSHTSCSFRALLSAGILRDFSSWTVSGNCSIRPSKNPKIICAI